jgi:hypothetical protein
MKKDENDDLRAQHLASAAHAKLALKNFTFSQRNQPKKGSDAYPEDGVKRSEPSRPVKAPPGGRPQPPARSRTYIAPAASVAEEQRKSIRGQLDALQSTGPGLALTIAKADIEKVIQDGHIDLSELIGRMEKAKSGTQFYTRGATIRDSMANQAAVDKFFAKYAPKGTADEEGDDADE